MTIIKVMSFLLIITFIAVVSFYKGGGVDEPIERDILYMDLPDNKFFIMNNDLSCEIIYSSNENSVGTVIGLLDLNTKNPQMLGSLGGKAPISKLFEDENIIVVGMIAYSSGASDIFHVDKNNGHFARSEGGMAFGTYAYGSTGICK